MPRLDNPVVLVTRPHDSAAQFVAALAQVAGPFRSVISPAFETVSVGAEIPAFDAAVFTSRAGVAFAPLGNNRPAFCVGQATAAAARDAGYSAISADGNADDLVDLILARAPKESLLHIRGEVSQGNVRERLRAGGLTCADVIAYRKSALAPTGAAVAALADAQQIIVPVFSAETGSILATWDIDFSRCHLVAISPAVAKSARGLGVQNISVVTEPNMAEMVAATSRLIA